MTSLGEQRFLKRQHLTREERDTLTKQATIKAQAILKPGDRLRITRCGGIESTVTFVAFNGQWIQSKTLDDIHAVHILKVNGEIVDFCE